MVSVAEKHIIEILKILSTLKFGQNISLSFQLDLIQENKMKKSCFCKKQRLFHKLLNFMLLVFLHFSLMK